MHQNLHTSTETKLTEAIIATLAFFSLYDLPISTKRLNELLFEKTATFDEIETELEGLFQDGKVVRAGKLYSLKNWDQKVYLDRQIEISKKWDKIDQYFNWLAILPFVRLVSVINSLALGTADSDSDIDFFVVTKPNRLYVVRSIIIVLFRLLGVYKRKQKIKDKFCFGFFVSEDNLNLEPLLIQPQDPYFLFWLANMRPIVGGQKYWELMQQNQWLLKHFPNLRPMNRHATVRKPNFFIRATKTLVELVLWLPSLMLEPILRRIHISHTFKLAENNTASSSTIANAQMLKLHGFDVRAEVARAYSDLLQSLQ